MPTLHSSTMPVVALSFAASVESQTTALVGYLKKQAATSPVGFMGLLGRVLPPRRLSGIGVLAWGSSSRSGLLPVLGQ